MGEDRDRVTVWIRPEEADHPKLEKLRRAVAVDVQPQVDTTRPWVAWAAGLSRAWLVGALERRAQVLILPPWPEGGFASVPSVRVVAPPASELLLGNDRYGVAAGWAVEPSPVWQEHGLFAGTKVAWLVAHEPFAGAGFAWLCTAELLVASASTRPREARRLLRDLVAYLSCFCREGQAKGGEAGNAQSLVVQGFTREDAPYLLAALAIPGIPDAKRAAEITYRRLGVDPDQHRAQELLARPEVRAELAKPIGKRDVLARIVDAFGYRSYRLEIEETAHE